MFKSLDSIASVVGIFMYLTISKFKQVLRSRKGLDYNTDHGAAILFTSIQIHVAKARLEGKIVRFLFMD